MLVSGYNSHSGFAVARLTTAGELDSSFNSDGKQTINFHGFGLGIAVDDNALDLLTGSSGQDWFLFNAEGEAGSKKDKVTDLKADEFALDLDFINGV